MSIELKMIVMKNPNEKTLYKLTLSAIIEYKWDINYIQTLLA